MPEQDHDIPLESYATVIAALGAGLPLASSLAHADILPSEWGAVAEQWQSRIDESAATDLSLLVAFDAALLAAKRRFEPAIEPIESDVAAWASFRRHFLTATDPLAFLAEHELSPSTYARIEADWANRTASDDALAEALQSHLLGPLGECPTLTRAPSRLLSDKSAPPEPGPEPARSREPEPPVLPELPPELPQHPLPIEPRAPFDALPDVPVAAPNEIETAPPQMSHPLPDIDATLMGSLPANVPTLPFHDAAPSSPDLPWLTEAMRGLSGDETLMGSFVAEGPALPFDEDADTLFPPAEPGPAQTPRIPWLTEAMRGLPAGETLMAPLDKGGAALPFDKTGKAPADISETLPILNLASIPTLPFKEGGTPPDTPGTETEQPRRASGWTDTEPLPQKLGPAGEPPWLSLEQYAALCVELRLYSSYHAEVLRRYSIDAAQCRALDAYWSPRVQADANLRAAWDSYYVAHWSRLRAAQRPR